MRGLRSIALAGGVSLAFAIGMPLTAAAAPGGNDGGNGGNGGGHGANQPGPYDPNGVGAPSGNGKSENNNGKRPCAGCVGNADGKNPPGQMPNGSDHNKGYECDANQGVGKTNPAHSGCGSTTTTTPPPGANPGGGNPGGGNPGGGNPGGGNPGGDNPAAPAQEGGEAGGGQNVAGAQEGGGQDRGTIPSNPAGAPSGEEVQTAPTGGDLPFTGSEPLLLALLGLLALGLGFGVRRVMLARSRA